MGYEQLRAIIQESRAEAVAAERAEVTECPECAFAPLKENRAGDKCCPICGWARAHLSAYVVPQKPFG